MTLLPLLIFAASGAAQTPPAHLGRTFFSPMGEPFRPQKGYSGLAEWFAEADANHDGKLALDEMQADAARFFAELDVNHDGEIDPDEITHYETVVAPEISGAGPDDAAYRYEGAARYGLLNLPEPVTSADSNFNRGVSLAEFRQAATQRFVALDLDHHGYLTLAGLQGVRPAPSAQRKRHGDDQPPPPDDGARSYRPQ